MKKKTGIIIGVAAVLVVGVGVTAAVAGPAFYRDVIVGEPDAAPTVSLTPGASTVDQSQLTGDWSVGDGSSAGYRVDEVLNGTDVTVVGTTDQVSGTVTVDGTTVTAADITAQSDARLKQNVRVIDNALSLVERMRGVRFTRDSKDGIGVIAQEMREVIPEVVLENSETGILSVAYGNLVGVLIEAVRELSAKVAKLEGDA